MEILAPNSTCLELSIAMPGFSASSSFPSSGKKGGTATLQLLDINQAPLKPEEECMEEEDDEESPNSSGPSPRKKLRLSKEQSRRLEQSFLQNQALNPKEKEILAMELRLKTRQVEVWFQNRRARSKMKQTEIECEYLKRWLAALTEQNMKLKKEVEDLKAAPPTGIPQPPPPSTLVMCPRCACERLTTTTFFDDQEGPTTTTPEEGRVPFLRRRRSSSYSNM